MPAPAADFDRLAAVYDSLTVLAFGRLLRRPTHWVLAVGLPPDARQVLFIGGGTGQELPAVLARCPQAHIDFVDASGQMLVRARATVQRRCPPADAARVSFWCGTEADLPAGRQYEAVVAFYFLDLFTPAALAQVLAQLATATVPATRWLIADFAPPQRRWQKVLLVVLYRFFGFTTRLATRQLPDWPAALAAHGLVATAEAAFGWHGLLRAGCWRGAGTALPAPP